MRRAVATGLAVLLLAGCAQAPPAPKAASTSAPADPGPSAAATAQVSAAHAELRVHRAGFRLPVAFGREAVISTGRYAIVAGGLPGGDASIATAYRIDLRQGRVTSMPSLPVAVHDTAGGTANGRPVVIGGGNASEQSTVQGWAGRHWQLIGRLPQARSDLVAATVAGRVIVLGGYDGVRPAEQNILSSADGRQWKIIGKLPVPVRYPAGTVSGGAIWLFGGERGGVMQTAIQRVDPGTGQAQVAARLPIALGHAAAMPFGDRILIAGGRTSTDKVTDRMWWFNPRTRTIHAAGRLPVPLADSAIAQWDHTYYLIGGETPGVTRTILEVAYR